MTRSASSRKPGAKSGFQWQRDLALVWAGMVIGVSFLATPAKFRVKSLPRPIALEVGRQTFRMLGQVEAVPALLLGLRAAAPAGRLLAPVPGAIVLMQALWLRPRLTARTRQIVEGGVPPPAPALHSAYVASELAKLGALLGLGLLRRSAPSPYPESDVQSPRSAAFLRHSRESACAGVTRGAMPARFQSA